VEFRDGRVAGGGLPGREKSVHERALTGMDGSGAFYRMEGTGRSDLSDPVDEFRSCRVGFCQVVLSGEEVCVLLTT
jgi:hypothetical protein